MNGSRVLPLVALLGAACIAVGTFASSIAPDQVLAAMRRFRAQMAVVMDQHGGTAGLVTMEDLFEEVVGDFEEGQGRRSIVREAPGRLKVRGTVRLEEAAQALGYSLQHPKVTTISGLVLLLLGFAATDFIMLKTISLADAAAHVIKGEELGWLSAVARWLADLSTTYFGPTFTSYFTEQLIVTLILGFLGFLFWFLLRHGFNRNVIAIAVPLVAVYLILNGIIIGALFVGIIMAIRQVMRLFPEVRWVNGFRLADPGLTVNRPPVLLAPMAAVICRSARCARRWRSPSPSPSASPAASGAQPRACFRTCGSTAGVWRSRSRFSPRRSSRTSPCRS